MIKTISEFNGLWKLKLENLGFKNVSFQYEGGLNFYYSGIDKNNPKMKVLLPEIERVKKEIKDKMYNDFFRTFPFITNIPVGPLLVHNYIMYEESELSNSLRTGLNEKLPQAGKILQKFNDKARECGEFTENIAYKTLSVEERKFLQDINLRTFRKNLNSTDMMEDYTKIVNSFTKHKIPATVYLTIDKIWIVLSKGVPGQLYGKVWNFVKNLEVPKFDVKVVNFLPVEEKENVLQIKNISDVPSIQEELEKPYVDKELERIKAKNHENNKIKKAEFVKNLNTFEKTYGNSLEKPIAPVVRYRPKIEGMMKEINARKAKVVETLIPKENAVIEFKKFLAGPTQLGKALKTLGETSKADAQRIYGQIIIKIMELGQISEQIVYDAISKVDRQALIQISRKLKNLNESYVHSSERELWCVIDSDEEKILIKGVSEDRAYEVYDKHEEKGKNCEILMKFIFIVIFGFYGVLGFSQKITDIIKTKIYTSYFSNETHTPLIVVYSLYKGGGKCSRLLMTFKVGKLTANYSDYNKSGYDIGHMCNAEDFAYDCNLEILTFQFYNAIPQTLKLNRGVWKENESLIRYKSQTDSLLIICGGFNYDSGLKIKNKISIPKYCFKITQSKTTKQTTTYIFPNDTSEMYGIYDLSQLFNNLPSNYISIINSNLLK